MDENVGAGTVEALIVQVWKADIESVPPAPEMAHLPPSHRVEAFGTLLVALA